MYTVIDNNGYIVDYCVKNDYKCKDGERVVPQYLEFNTLKLINPKWSGSKWIEGASQSEINQENINKNKNSVIVSDDNKILSSIIKDNAELKMQMTEIKLKLNELCGGKINE